MTKTGNTQIITHFCKVIRNCSKISNWCFGLYSQDYHVLHVINHWLSSAFLWLTENSLNKPEKLKDWNMNCHGAGMTRKQTRLFYEMAEESMNIWQAKKKVKQCWRLIILISQLGQKNKWAQTVAEEMQAEGDCQVFLLGEEESRLLPITESLQIPS